MKSTVTSMRPPRGRPPTPVERRFAATTSLWPGLAQVWSGQEFLGVILAALFAATLNLAVVTRFIWTESVPRGFPAFFAALSVLTWFAGLAYTCWWVWRCHPDRHKAEVERLFREALDHYLQGHWNEARRRLEQVLTLDETDADALMQLGSLYVRTDQPDLARKSFRQCLELESGVKWRWEIAQALGKIGDA